MNAFKRADETIDQAYVAGLKREIAGHEEAFKRTRCAAAEMCLEELRWELRTYLGEAEPVLH